MTKPTITINPSYRVDGGNEMPIHGKVNYSMVCENGDGEIFGEDGRNVKLVSSFSAEIVGTDLSPNVDAGQPHVPAKWIRAENGDIFLEAPSGNIYLSAKNIVLSATGTETDDEQNGNIDIIASNDLTIKSEDTVKINSTNCYLNATLSMDICGKGFLRLAGRLTTGGSSVDASANILSTSSTIIKFLTDFGGLA